MIARLAVAAALVALLAACAGAPPSESMPDRTALESDGRDIAEAQCAACHAVGPYGDSPNASAPPFRTILTRYSASVLEEELIAGIQIAHPMPEFQFNPQATDALIAYLQSIQQSPPAPTP